MIKKVIRLFWSLDVMKTEKWLSVMANNGYRLEKVNFVTREFVFKNDQRKMIQYRICRQKAGASATSPSLIRGLWYSAYSKGKWSILANENKTSELKIFPSRESILKRNRIIKYSLGIFLGYQAFGMALPISFLIASFFSITVTSHFEPGAKLSLTVVLFVLSLLFYILVRLIRSDIKLRQEIGSALTLSKRKLDRKTEKALQKEGKLIKKRKLAWMYAPDKIETWLEDKERQGYNLYRMSRTGNTFYFIKGEPRTIKFCVDYQKLAKNSYFEIHKSSGWEMSFTSKSTFMKYTIWRKEYSTEKPQLYSDNMQILKHAKNNVCYIVC